MISLYWSLADTAHGNIIGQIEYADGALQSDGTRQYTWEIDPGILTQNHVYIFSVIDDHTNIPVYTDRQTLAYGSRLRGTVEFNNTNQAGIVVGLEPDDPNNHVVSTTTGSNGFVFYNVPNGAYTLNAYSNDTLKSFRPYLTDNGSVVNTSTKLESPGWISTKFAFTNPMESEYVNVTFLLASGLSIFGGVLDLVGNLVHAGITVILMDSDLNMLGQTTMDEGGYAFYGLAPGTYTLGYIIPSNISTYHWDGHSVIPRGVNVMRIKPVQYMGYADREDIMINSGQGGPYIRLLDTDTNEPVEGGLVTLVPNLASHSPLHGASDENGMISYSADDVAIFANYTFMIAWPEGYETASVPSLFSWHGGVIIIPIYGRKL